MRKYFFFALPVSDASQMKSSWTLSMININSSNCHNLREACPSLSWKSSSPSPLFSTWLRILLTFDEMGSVIDPSKERRDSDGISRETCTCNSLGLQFTGTGVMGKTMDGREFDSGGLVPTNCWFNKCIAMDALLHKSSRLVSKLYTWSPKYCT